MKKKNVYEKRIKARNDAAQIFCWCIVIALNQEEGIGSERLGRACDEMKTFEDKFKNMIQSSGRKAASVEMERLLDGVCDTDIILLLSSTRRHALKSKSEWQKTMVEELRGL